MMFGKSFLDNMEEGTKREFCISNAVGSYSSTTIIGMNTKPYHGLYVKALTDKQTGNYTNNIMVLLSSIQETLTIGKDVFPLYSVSTNEGNVNGYEYLESFERHYVPKWTYRVNDVFITKTLTFLNKEDLLYVEYVVENRNDKDLIFDVEPLVTYRGLENMNRKRYMVFSQREVKDGIKINLSIEKDQSLVIKTKDAKYKNNPKYFEGVKYDYDNASARKRTYVEDLYIPGTFTLKVKSMHQNIIRFVVSTLDMDISEIDNMNYIDIENNRISNFIKKLDTDNMYIESLAVSANYLEVRHKKSWKKTQLSGLPGMVDDTKDLLKSLEGNFLLLKKIYESKEILRFVGNTLKNGLIQISLLGKPIQNNFDKIETTLWYVEAINRYMQYSESVDADEASFYPIIKQIIYNLMDRKIPGVYMDKDCLIAVNCPLQPMLCGKFIHINALWHNSLKIFIDMARKKDDEFELASQVANNCREEILKQFWISDKKTMRYEVKQDEHGSKVEMLYTLSLSYAAIFGETANQLLDTLFKEYYTAYGLRKVSKENPEYSGEVYPKYMGHFVKANLRQNGTTRATQKIGYNLVKELVEQIDDGCIGALPEKYNEIEKKDYGCLMSSLSIAEMIRILNMLL